MTTKNLLVELLVEELPPKALNKLGIVFANDIRYRLETAELLADKSGHCANGKTFVAYASPTRLAVWVKDVLAQAPDKQVLQRLMPVTVGFGPDGKPTLALLKKLAALGFDASVVPALKRGFDGKVEMLAIDTVAPGATIAEGLKKALDYALDKLPIPKVMTYQLADGWTSVSFVRPVHGLVALHGADIVPVTVLGHAAGRVTQGHRFEAANPALEIRNADNYELQMEEEGAVIPSFEKRRAEIIRQLDAAAAQEGFKPINDDALLDEVAALVERPNVLVGQFDAEFLEVPQECLILTMKANQKYFPLLDADGRLTNRFLIVSNIRPADASLVINGNERVVRPRLADAKFFYDHDRKKPLDARVLGLSRVVYHNRLGTQGERVERVQAISRAIGNQLGGEELSRQADQAALLAKADLLTDMVGEFPELQGIMGRYYAQHDGLPDEVAFAIEDHYRPRFAGDELPRNMVGVCVALADKLETLVGMFGIGQIPTGDKDPYALRRHALGVIRMLMEKNLNLPVDKLVRDSFSLMSPIKMSIGSNAISHSHLQPSTPDLVLNFMFERLSGLLREQSYSSHEIDAVLSLRPQLLTEVPKLLAAVRAFAALPEAASLSAANKRVGNILRKVEGVTGGEVDASLLQEPAEQVLHRTLKEIAPRADAAFATGGYTASLLMLAALREPVDAFFDNVMVNVDDAALRDNRLALLAQLHRAMNRVADISRLAN